MLTSVVGVPPNGRDWPKEPTVSMTIHTSGFGTLSQFTAHLSPSQAREFAGQLVAAAEAAESPESEVR